MTHKNLDKIAHELAKNYTTKEELIGDQGIFQQLFKKTLQAALDAELTQHLGYEKHRKLFYIGYMVNDFSIYFFWHILIKTAISCFYMKYWNLSSFCCIY